MSDVVKDVLIRVAIQQAKAQLQAPDVQAATKALKDFETRAQASSRQVAQSASAAAQAAASQLESTFARASKAMSGRVAQQVASLRELREVVKQQGGDYQSFNRQITEAIMLREREAAATRKQAQAAAQGDLEKANLRAAAAMRSLGEASMQALRGFVLLGASGHKEAEKILRSLLLVQGAIDLFKGGTGIVMGLVKAHQALAAAATASAAAQAASGAAGAGVRGLGAGALLSSSGAALGLGAFLGGAAIGYGLNRAGGGKILEALGIGEDPSREEERQRQQLIEQDRRDQRDMALRNATRRASSTLETQRERRELLGGAAERRRALDRGLAEAAIADARSNVSGAINLEERRAAQAGLLGAAASRGDLLARQDRRLTGDVFMAQAGALAARQALAGVDAQRGKVGSSEAFLASRAEAAEQVKRAEGEVAEAIQRQTRARADAVTAQRESLSMAKEMLATERDRVAGIQRGLGSLNAGEADEVKRLNRKVARGQNLAEEELRFLEGTGAFGDFTGEQRRKLGQKNFGANLEDVAALTGGGSQVDKLQAEIAKLVNGGDSGPGLNKLVEQIAKSQQDEAEAMKRLADSSAVFAKIVGEIDRLRIAVETANKSAARWQQHASR